MTDILHDELHAFRRTCPAAGLHITASKERHKFFSEFRRHLNVYKKRKDAKSHSKDTFISVKTSYMFWLYIAIIWLNIDP